MTALHELRIPYMGSVENARLVAWKVAEGASIVEGAVVCEIETDKTVTEVQADRSGRLVKQIASDGDELKVGALLGLVADSSASADEVSSALTAFTSRPLESSSVGPASTAASRAAPADASASSTQASPRVRRLAQEHGVDLAQVRGTGPDGRPTADDVLAAAHARGGAAGPASSAAIPPRIRRRSGRAYGEQPAAPHHRATTGRIGTHGAARHRRRPGGPEQGAGGPGADDEARARPEPKLSVLSYVARATCAALGSHPALNATFTDEAMLLWQVVNLGVAVDTEDGLVVPVIRDAARLDVGGIDRPYAISPNVRAAARSPPMSSKAARSRSRTPARWARCCAPRRS